MRKTVLIIIALFLFGCGGVVSREARRDVDTTITPAMVQREPDAYRDRKIIWQGTIVSTKNLRERSIIEVIYTPPKEPGSRGVARASESRFFIDTIGFLDPATYRKGIKIVAAGLIQGIVVQKLREEEYPYPVIQPTEMHLFHPKEAPASSY
jgi:outer membrane lipoprotein